MLGWLLLLGLVVLSVLNAWEMIRGIRQQRPLPTVITFLLLGLATWWTLLTLVAVALDRLARWI